MQTQLRTVAIVALLTGILFFYTNSTKKSEIFGNINSVVKLPDGSVQISGWACKRLANASIAVHIYAGGEIGSSPSRFVTSASANSSSSVEVSSACKTSNVGHNFTATLTRAMAQRFSGKSIYVYGVTKKKKTAIARSGELVLPTFEGELLLSELPSSTHFVIPQGNDVVIDKDLDVRLLTINGKMRCPKSGDFSISAEGIHVHGVGALFECGTEAKRFTGKLLVTIKPGSFSALCSEPQNPCSDKNIMIMNGGIIQMAGRLKNTKYLKLTKTAQKGQSEIFVSEAPDWAPGDRVALAPTGYNYLEAEDLIIESVVGNRIKFTTPLQHRHYGELERLTLPTRRLTIDQRAEVANLSRNIHFTSLGTAEEIDHRGAHMMVMKDGFAYIDGVEFSKMGRMGEMARYPFHWHRVGYATGQYIRNSSIHHSFQRCVTIHMTHNAEVSSNICYDHYGHGFFMEDGNERGNKIINNLGILTRRPLPNRHILESDISEQAIERFPGPATYWITNPDNEISGNVAAGSRGSGFWMSYHHTISCKDFCVRPDSDNPANVFPIKTNLGIFANNIARGAMVGMTWDGVQEGALTNNPRNLEDRHLITARYEPPQIPVFNDLQFHKNHNSAFYIRALAAVYNNFLSVDNGVGMFSAFNSAVNNSVIVARSNNQTMEDYSINSKFTGINIYDGPFDLNSMDLVGFKENPEDRNIPNLNISVFRINGAADRFVNAVRKVRFTPEPDYRVQYLGINPEKIGTMTSSAILDIDGSLVGQAGAIVVPKHPVLNSSERCDDLESGSGAQVCDYDLAVVSLNNRTLSFMPLQIFRDGRFVGAIGSAGHKVPVMLNNDHEYTIKHSANIDVRNMTIDVTGSKYNGLTPIVHVQNLPGVCRTQFGQKVTSIEQLRNSTGSAYFSSAGRISFRVKMDQQKAGSLYGKVARGSLGALTCD